MKLFKFFLFISVILIKAQTVNYRWPLDTPLVIVGNYGELRPNHFHAGLDFSTNNKINLPVYVVAGGYVSRIKVSSTGYGKAIYITHYNGKVTLYAHFTNYNKAINDYVKSRQLKNQSYEIEIFPEKFELKVNAGDLIGYSGNTGNTTGPHLHFEIRDEKTEMPLDPLSFYRIKDSIKPYISHIAFYDIADTSAPKFIDYFTRDKNLKSKYPLKIKDSMIVNCSILGIGFSGYDRFSKNGSPNNIHKVELYIDNIPYYSHTLNSIHFSDARYVNEFTDEQKVKIQKCFLPTIYPKNLYGRCFNKGRVYLTDTNYHFVQIIATDEVNNRDTLKFYLKTRKLNDFKSPSIKSDAYVVCDEDFIYKKNKLEIYIPARTLYNSTPLIFENTLETTGKLIILPTEANLNSTAIVGFETPLKYRANKNKLVFKNYSNTYLPIVKNDSVFYAVKNFGWFNLMLDTVAPKVKTSVPIAKLKKMKGLKQLDLVVEDNLSGIKDYRLYVNEYWVLAEFDLKSNLLTYYFDGETPKGELNFRLEVTDKCANKTEYRLKLQN